MTAEEYIASQDAAGRTSPVWLDWLAEHRVDAIVEPTLPIVAPVRGRGYDEPFGDIHDLSLTYYWNGPASRGRAAVRSREPERLRSASR